MSEEYNFIRDYIEKNPDVKERFLSAYWFKKFNNYLFTYNRIDINYKKEFIKFFSNEFKNAVKDKEPVFELLRSGELKTLKLIIKNPMRFYRKTLNRLSLTEKIFSIRNLRNRNRVHKIIRICGIKLKFRNKAKEREIMAKERQDMLCRIKAQNDRILKYLEQTLRPDTSISEEMKICQK